MNKGQSDEYAEEILFFFIFIYHSWHLNRFVEIIYCRQSDSRGKGTQILFYSMSFSLQRAKSNVTCTLQTNELSNVWAFVMLNLKALFYFFQVGKYILYYIVFARYIYIFTYLYLYVYNIPFILLFSFYDFL